MSISRTGGVIPVGASLARSNNYFRFRTMLVGRTKHPGAFRCPRIVTSPRRLGPDKGGAVAGSSWRRYSSRSVPNLPVPVDHADSVSEERAVAIAHSPKRVTRREAYAAATAGPEHLASPPDPGSARNVRRLIDLSRQASARLKAQVVGGGTVGDGRRPPPGAPATETYDFDASGTQSVLFVADVHWFPPPDATLSSVVARAILEHVLRARWVAAITFRWVLRLSSLAHAATPFARHRHEDTDGSARRAEGGHHRCYPAPRVRRAGDGRDCRCWSTVLVCRGLPRREPVPLVDYRRVRRSGVLLAMASPGQRCRGAAHCGCGELSMHLGPRGRSGDQAEGDHGPPPGGVRLRRVVRAHGRVGAGLQLNGWDTGA